jgi:hypothetical protein
MLHTAKVIEWQKWPNLSDTNKTAYNIA